MLILRLAKLVPVALTAAAAAYEFTRPHYITTSKKKPKSIENEIGLLELQGGKMKWVKESKQQEMLEEGWEYFERKKYVVKRERFRHPDGSVLMIRKPQHV